MKPTYKLAPDGRSIECLICGAVSHHPEDVRQRYCGRCHAFHADLKPCGRCDEPILPGEALAPFEGTPLHWECGARMVFGGVNHQLGKCTCCGGTEPPDPPGMTRRQAALAAVEHFYKAHPQHGCEQEAPQKVPPKTRPH